MLAEKTIPKFAGQPFAAFVIHVGDAALFGTKLAQENGNAFPLLLDLDNTVLNQYIQIGAEKPLFPLGYLVDRQGQIRHVYNEPDGDEEDPTPPTLYSDIEALLAE